MEGGIRLDFRSLSATVEGTETEEKNEEKDDGRKKLDFYTVYLRSVAALHHIYTAASDIGNNAVCLLAPAASIRAGVVPRAVDRIYDTKNLVLGKL